MRGILYLMVPMNGLLGEYCTSCYQLDIGVAIGIITCDIILTLLIALSVYCFISHQKRRGSLHTHARCCGSGMSVCKRNQYRITAVPELYGVQSDIYSDLQQYRK
uniref:TYRO protein tyrosine kinase-binding protein n=1 Tax=Sinocyclocheilus grahami TaxID=75366 RepID=A0A672S962_SINGR